MGYGDTLVVTQGLKTNFMYQVLDKKVMVTDLTLGTDGESIISYCMSMKHCADDPSYVVTNQKSFIYEYPSYGKYIVKLEAKDAYGNTESIRQIIDLQPPT